MNYTAAAQRWKLLVLEEAKQDCRRERREGSVATAEQCAISTVCGAAAVHGCFQVWEIEDSETASRAEHGSHRKSMKDRNKHYDYR